MTGELLGAFLTGASVGCLSAGLLVAAFHEFLPDRTTPKTPAAGAPLPPAAGGGLHPWLAEQPTAGLPRITHLDDARRAHGGRKDFA